MRNFLADPLHPAYWHLSLLIFLMLSYLIFVADQTSPDRERGTVRFIASCVAAVTAFFWSVC
ncbi:MAG: hypothetical protein IPN42_18370 [Methylococcaceae bacterium]|nr:hypothetical protein [Methylococcaceae bacterium]